MLKVSEVYIRKRSILLLTSRPTFLYLALFILYLLYTYLFADKLALQLGGAGYETTFSNSEGSSIFSALMVAPIVEELLFRTHLSGKKKHYWAFLLPFFFSMIIFREQLIWISLFLILVVVAGILDRKYNDKSEFISKALFYVMFVLTAIIFALIHIDYAGAQSIKNALTITLVSYLPLSVFLGYIRYKRNLLYAMLTHALLNFSMLSINEIIY